MCQRIKLRRIVCHLLPAENLNFHNTVSNARCCVKRVSHHSDSFFQFVKAKKMDEEHGLAHRLQVIFAEFIIISRWNECKYSALWLTIVNIFSFRCSAKWYILWFRFSWSTRWCDYILLYGHAVKVGGDRFIIIAAAAAWTLRVHTHIADSTAYARLRQNVRNQLKCDLRFFVAKYKCTSTLNLIQ